MTKYSNILTDPRHDKMGWEAGRFFPHFFNKISSPKYDMFIQNSLFYFVKYDKYILSMISMMHASYDTWCIWIMIYMIHDAYNAWCIWCIMHIKHDALNAWSIGYSILFQEVFVHWTQNIYTNLQFQGKLTFHNVILAQSMSWMSAICIEVHKSTSQEG